MTATLFVEIEDLLSQNDDLIEKLHEFYYSNNIISDCHGMMVLRNDGMYARYRRRKYREILRYKKVALDVAKFSKLLSIHTERKIRHMDSIDEDKFNTILNGAVETENAILRYLERCSM